MQAISQYVQSLPVFEKFDSTFFQETLARISQLAEKVFAKIKSYIPPAIVEKASQISYANIGLGLLPLTGLFIVTVLNRSKSTEHELKISTPIKKKLPLLPPSPASSPLYEHEASYFYTKAGDIPPCFAI